MKLTFAGVGGAFCSQTQYQSNMVFESDAGKRLLLDCGGDARFSLGELGATNANIGSWCDGVYVSHLHADHIGGLEWLGFCTYFNPKSPKPKLWIVDTLIDDLWDSLKGGMRSIQNKQMRLIDFFDVQPTPINSSFVWESYVFWPVQTVHVMDGMRIVPSYGLLVESPIGKTTYITTDTQFAPRQIETFYNRAEQIFHDCETSLYPSGVHAHYNDMRNLDSKYKEKMWLYHHSETTINPKDDGFLGFVTKGQSFDI
jgi:ribonuclease BN (tRNA processing enzyme)